MRDYNTYNPISIDIDQLFGDVFPEGIPNNAYIDKSKTALGLTYEEFHSKRNSIIVVPTKTIINDKVRSYASMKPFGLHGDTKNVEDGLKAYLKNDKIANKKIVTTPDSFGRIIKVAKDEGMLDEVLETYFCFLDELHCYATEGFRELILTPLKWFWKFKHKAVGSATPYHFSDPNFHKLDYFKLNFKEKFGTITLIEHENVVEALAFLLSDLSKFQGNIHIFLNSVELINRVINKAGLKGKDTLAVFCADEDRNANALGENGEYFRETPYTGQYAKVNFYSTRYNEGWDLVDNEKCTFVLATDAGYKHSLASVQFKGFQAVGRLRSNEKVNGRPKIIKPHTIYHITNTIPLTKQQAFKDLETVEAEWYFEANEHVAYYNSFIRKCKEEQMENKGLVDKLIRRLADVNEEGAIVNATKVDQNVYEEYYRQFYYSGELLQQAWEEMNYDVVIKLLPNDITVIGEGRKAVNRRIIQTLEHIKQNPSQYDEIMADAYRRKLSTTHQDLWSSYLALGPKKMEELDYDDKLMRKERLKISNKQNYALIKQAVIDELGYGNKLARPMVKDLLKAKYVKHTVYNNRMQTKKPNVNDLRNEMGIEFEQKGKIKYEGKLVPAIILIEPGGELEI